MHRLNAPYLPASPHITSQYTSIPHTLESPLTNGRFCSILIQLAIYEIIRIIDLLIQKRLGRLYEPLSPPFSRGQSGLLLRGRACVAFSFYWHKTQTGALERVLGAWWFVCQNMAVVGLVERFLDWCGCVAGLMWFGLCGCWTMQQLLVVDFIIGLV